MTLKYYDRHEVHLYETRDLLHLKATRILFVR